MGEGTPATPAIGRMQDSDLHLEAASGSNLPPGPRMPGGMQTLQWMYRPIEFMEKCRRKYGRIFSLSLGPASNVFVIADPTAAKQVLTADPEYFRAGDTNGIFRDVVGNHSILVMDGPEHIHHRRILLPVVGRHAERYRELIAGIARERVATWKPDSDIRLLGEMEAISFEVMMRIAMGTDGTSEREDKLRKLIPQMMDRCESPFTLIPWFRHEMGGISPYARLMRFIDGIDEILYEIISERRADPLTEIRDDALSLLIRATYEDGSPLEDRVIRDELLTMLMAGYETTTAGLTWSFERLLRSPDKLERLTREMETGDQTYLMAVVNEAPTRHSHRRPEGPGPDRVDGLQPPGWIRPDGRDLSHPQRSGAVSGAQGVPTRALSRIRTKGHRGRSVDPVRRRNPPLPGCFSGAIRAGGGDSHRSRGGRARVSAGVGRTRRPPSLHALTRQRGTGTGTANLSWGELTGRLSTVQSAEAGYGQPR
jgi:cytochrome P450